MAFSVRYKFSQKFRVPARKAFEWCTNYEPSDIALMGDVGKRSIVIISEDTLILDDTIRVGKTVVKKKKLVRIYKEDLFWTSTHLVSPVKYSQFLYRISPESKSSSRIDFVGLQVEPGKIENLSARAQELRKIDSTLWKKFAAEMEKDLNISS